MLSEMKLRYFRVEGVCLNNTYIPNDIVNITSQSVTDSCKFETNVNIENTVLTMQNSSKTHFITGLCTTAIRSAELFCTMSHLLAIYRAVHSTTATSKYALIMEDDVYIPISTDYNALADSAPSDFGVLQLLTSQVKWLKSMRDEYIKKPKHGLWSKRTIKSKMWSAGFYLINRERLRPIIDAIIHIDPKYPTIIQFRIIAALSDNKPGECNTTTTSSSYTPHTAVTMNSTSTSHVPVPTQVPVSAVLVSTSLAESSYNHTSTIHLACVGYWRVIADGFIYAMTPTYTIKLPIAYHKSDFKSTFQPEAIRATATQETITMSTLMNTNYTIPSFPFRLACIGNEESVPKPEYEKRV